MKLPALAPLLFALLALSGCGGRTLNAPPEPVIPMYRSAAGAQAHCPGDQVVWVDTMGGTYHSPNEPAYGRALQGGAFACRREAVASPLLRHGNDLSD